MKKKNSILKNVKNELNHELFKEKSRIQTKQ